MREHIYKAWSKEKGRWLTLDDRLTIAGESDFWHAWGTGTSSDGTIFLFQDMGAELVEYTGLKDCKRTKKYPEGQMIFEGDVLLIQDEWTDRILDDGSGPIEPCNHLATVIFQDGSFGIMIADSADIYKEGFWSFPGIEIEIGDSYSEFEIVGNIYESSFLLDTKEV